MARKPKQPAVAAATPKSTPKVEAAVPAAKPKFQNFSRIQWVFLAICGVVALWALNLNKVPSSAPAVALVPTVASIEFTPMPLAIIETPTMQAVIVQAAASVTPSATITETSIVPTAVPPTSTTIPVVEVLVAQPSPTFIIVENQGLGDVMVFNPVKTFYAGANGAKLRTCPQRTCDIAASLLAGDKFTANGALDGEAVNEGNMLWYRTDVGGKTLYAYSGIFDTNPPAGNTVIGGTSSTDVSSNSPTTSQTGAVGSCPNMRATCGQLTCDEARACLAAGNTSLDSDGDQKPCETMCGG